MSGALAKIVLSRGYSNNKHTDKVYIVCSTYSYLSRGNLMYKTGPYTDEEVDTIRKMYLNHFDKEISDVLNRSPKSINYKISKLGLTGRVGSTHLMKVRRWEAYENKYGMPMKEILHKLHWDEKLPVRNGMDELLGVESSSVAKWMDALGVKKRTIAEDNHRRYSTMTDEQIKAQTKAANDYVREHGNPHQIGRPAWCTGLTKETHPGLMVNSIKHMGENNPMYNVCGENHPVWKGGKKYWRQKEWYTIREEVKKRDGYTCQDCGMDEQESDYLYGSPLQVHHIIPYRECKKHEMDNLITLCSSCHAKADGNLIGCVKWKQRRLSASKESNPKQSTIYQY